MWRRRIAFALLALPLLAAQGLAQQATEQFIPIGRSPGLSGGKTLVGRVVSSDPAKGSLTLAAESGEVEVGVGEGTRIWLDRSGRGEPNTVGTLADCAQGRTVEVRLLPESETADWVKVRVSVP